MNSSVSNKERAFTYFKELGQSYQSMEVTLSTGQSLGFDTAIEEIVKKVVQTHNNGKKIIFIGNGGSSAIASHMAIDYWKNGGLRAIAFNDPAQLTCLANDYGYEYVFEKPIQMFAEKGDFVVAISSSGKSKNIINGVVAAKEKGCEVITLSGFGADNPLRKMGSLNFFIPSHSYGFVEIGHLVICHTVIDLSMQK